MLLFLFFSNYERNPNQPTCVRNYVKEKGTNAFFSGLLWSDVCCQPQDGFSVFLARIEQGAIQISLPSPVTEDLWNLLDLIILLIFPCLSICHTLYTKDLSIDETVAQLKNQDDE